jgi:flagellar protein FliO/FliZ
MIPHLIRIAAFAVGSLTAGFALAQQATPTAAPKAFAAPETAASLPSGTAGGIGQATLALLVVLVVIFGIAWVARRLRGMTGTGAQGIDVIAQAAVGPRERVVVVRIGATRLVLGVAPGRVSALHELPADATIDSTQSGGKPPNLVESFRSLMTRGAR